MTISIKFQFSLLPRLLCISTKNRVVFILNENDTIISILQSIIKSGHRAPVSFNRKFQFPFFESIERRKVEGDQHKSEVTNYCWFIFKNWHEIGYALRELREGDIFLNLLFVIAINLLLIHEITFLWNLIWGLRLWKILFHLFFYLPRRDKQWFIVIIYIFFWICPFYFDGMKADTINCLKKFIHEIANNQRVQRVHLLPSADHLF